MAFHYRGKAQFHLGNIPASEKDLLTALPVYETLNRPDIDSLYLYLGRVYFKKGYYLQDTRLQDLELAKEFSHKAIGHARRRHNRSVEKFALDLFEDVSNYQQTLLPKSRN